MVAHAQRRLRAFGLVELDGHLHLRARVFDGVVHQVRHHGFQLVLVRQHLRRRTGQQGFAIGQRVIGQMVARPCERHAVLHDRRQIHRRAARVADFRADASRAEDLLDGALQPFGVLDHHLVELLPLGVIYRTGLQRLEVEAHRRDGRLQLVRHRVDERVVLFVSPDLADQEDRVEDDAGDDEREDEDAEDQQAGFAPVDDDPADVEEQRGGGKADAEDDEKRDRPPPAA